jgi:hypothetical protein
MAMDIEKIAVGPTPPHEINVMVEEEAHRLILEAIARVTPSARRRRFGKAPLPGLGSPIGRAMLARAAARPPWFH